MLAAVYNERCLDVSYSHFNQYYQTTDWNSSAVLSGGNFVHYIYAIHF